MKENKIWNDYLPEDMQEHWTVYECLKESEDSSTFLVKETATGIQDNKLSRFFLILLLPEIRPCISIQFQYVPDHKNL